MDRAAFNFRMPGDLREEAQALAERDGLSLNAFCVQALRSHVDFKARQVAKSSARPARPAPGLARVPDEVPVPKVGANQPCPCGSGQKYKRCHGRA